MRKEKNSYEKVDQAWSESLVYASRWVERASARDSKKSRIYPPISRPILMVFSFSSLLSVFLPIHPNPFTRPNERNKNRIDFFSNFLTVQKHKIIVKDFSLTYKSAQRRSNKVFSFVGNFFVSRKALVRCLWRWFGRFRCEQWINICEMMRN